MAASAYIGYLYGIEEGRHQEKTSQISKYSTYLDKQNEELRTKRLAEEAKATKVPWCRKGRRTTLHRRKGRC